MKLKKRYMFVIIAALAAAMALGLSACGEPEDPLDESLAPVNGAAAHEGELNEGELIVSNGGQVGGLQVVYEKVYTMKTYDAAAAEAEAAAAAEETQADAEASGDEAGDAEAQDADTKDTKDTSGEEAEADTAETAEPGVTQQAVMLLGVKNNSERTLDFTFKDKGVDKEGNEILCEDPTNIIYAVGPGETRYFQQRIDVEGDDAANIDQMSGNKNNKRFKVTDSKKTSFKSGISIPEKVKYAPEGVWNILAANNSEYTGETDIGAIFMKDGEPVYFATTPLCNMNADGTIAWLEPGQTTDEATFLPSGGNAYDKVYLFVNAYTLNTQ